MIRARVDSTLQRLEAFFSLHKKIYIGYMCRHKKSHKLNTTLYIDKTQYDMSIISTT